MPKGNSGRNTGGIIGKVNKPSGGGNAVTIITASDTFNVQNNTTEIDILTIAGGGGGGTDNGGGGGAGGFRSFTTQPVTAEKSIAVTVGAGGVGSDASPATVAGAGSDSVFSNPANSITSDGGGFGGSNNIAHGPGDGSDGGSGGGTGGGAPGS